MAETILIVDDDLTLRETSTYNLERQGYHVFAATDGVEAIRLAWENKPDLILLDLMLPRVDGLGVCRILRQEMNVPILMLTARVDEIDRVVGLELRDRSHSNPESMSYWFSWRVIGAWSFRGISSLNGSGAGATAGEAEPSMCTFAGFEKN